MMNRRTSTLATLAVTGGLLAAGAGPAAAHTEFKSSTPKKGSKVSTRITKVTITFTQQIRSGTLSVTGPGNKKVSTGKGGQDPRNVARLAVGLKSGLKAGTYKVSWSIKAVDGHSQKGTYTFRAVKK